jgi:hypothetical protein
MKTALSPTLDHPDLAALRSLRDHYAAAIEGAVRRGQDHLVGELAAAYVDEARCVLGPAA